MRSIVLLFLIMLSSIVSYSQSRIFGYVLDKDTKEPLGSATIQVEGMGSVVSDSLGFFSMPINTKDPIDIVVSHFRCKPLQLHLHPKALDKEQFFLMPHIARLLHEVNIHAVTQTTDKINISDIVAEAHLSLSSVFEKFSGVNTLNTGATIGKPIIRGMHSNRVVIYSNGVRLESQQWGSEHAPEIDLQLVNHLSVIKDGNAVRYGSDAIGGIIIAEEKPYPQQPGQWIKEVSSSYFTNNRQYGFSGKTLFRLKKIPSLAFRFEGVYKRAGYGATPSYILNNTSFRQSSFSVGSEWSKKGFKTELAFSYYKADIGIFAGAHIGNIQNLVATIERGEPPVFLKDVPFSYDIAPGKQDVTHSTIKYKISKEFGKDKLEAILSYQVNQRLEFDRTQLTVVPRAQLFLNQKTFITDVHYTKDRFIWNGDAHFGATITYKNNDYNRLFFIPAFEHFHAGIYTFYQYPLKNNISFSYGFRYDFDKNVNIVRYNAYITQSPFFHAPTGNISIRYKPKKWLDLHLVYARLWRVPYVNEWYAQGVHHSSARYEIGDPDLLPEKSNSLSFDIHVKKQDFNVNVVPYAKLIDDYIFMRPQYPLLQTIRGAFPSFEFSQTDAFFYGIDANYELNILRHVKLEGLVSIVRARDIVEKDWIIFIPPDRFTLDINLLLWNVSIFKDMKFKITHQLVDRQTRIPRSGNIPASIINPSAPEDIFVADFAPTPDAFYLLGAEFSTILPLKKSNSIKIVLGVNNLLNTTYKQYLDTYRYYASSVGTNAYVVLSYTF